MLEKVRRYVKEWHMLEKEDRVIVGVSGGADSVCLLFVLSKLQEEIPFEIIAVHVNHGIRGAEADRDEAYVKELCEKMGIPFVSYLENVELIAKNRKQSTEEAGREVRRSCFKAAMERYAGNKVALAHHMNDNAETLLLNLARGTGLRGLGGIKPVQGKYIRPLLCVSREEIEAYLKNADIFYCEDATNATDTYTRNRIRNHVIPHLQQEVNAAALTHMCETMAQLQVIEDYMQQQTAEAFSQAVQVEKESYLFRRDVFSALHEALKPLVVKEVLKRIAGSEKDLEQSHLQAVLELFEKQVGRQLDLPYQMIAKRVYEGVRIRKRQEVCKEAFVYDISLQIGNQGTIVYDDMRLQYRIIENSIQKSSEHCFACDIIQDGLTVRTRRPGDYITIHADGRTQKLKSFFINEKVPQEMRDRILLLADGSHVLWIVGMRANCLYQVRSETKQILEIQVDKGEKS